MQEKLDPPTAVFGPTMRRFDCRFHRARRNGWRQRSRSYIGLIMPQQLEPNGRFAVCVETRDYRASLERWKIYRVIDDADAERHSQLRVVDESGEDYLYPREYFRSIDLPQDLEALHRRQAHE